MTDTKQPEKPTEAPTRIKWVASPHGVFEYYSNQGTVTWSLDDVMLHFAQISTLESTAPGEKLSTVNIERARITIPWRGAKILQLQLATLIANYESVNGEINLTPQLTSNEGT
ncbi:MAG: DUF3467 domain-containing protein [Candidatus Angelobacter sp.]